ncbi:MAG: GNAT family N-acetyltransferase [Chlorobiaceae bacterium]|nr:GNAT family N-acetyltransferase [Chlorobiaceae bacterium]
MQIMNIMEYWNMHHIPSPEMDSLDLSCFFIARISGTIAGAAGYKIIGPEEGKTTLLGIIPEFAGMGLGRELQFARLEAMYNEGVRKVTTNADRPETILWYKKHYGCKEVGKLGKLCEFGLPEVDHWTMLEMDLDAYMKTREEREKHRKDYIESNDPHPLSPYPPLIINVCLTGMVPSKLSNPSVPVTPDEIIADAVKVFDAGARVVHIHARDNNGNPTPDAKIYETIISGIRREREKLVCCVTTSGRNWKEFEQRAEVLYLDGTAKPDMASLTLGSMNFFSGASTNSIEMIERLAMAMKERNIKPEIEVFEAGMINLARYLERNGIIGGRKYFNILLGNINTAPATIGTLASLSESLPENSVWAAAGLGQFQLPVNAAAIVAGGHVRTGIEDSLFYDYQREVLATNENLTRRIVRLAGEMQRRIATPEETRALMGLST